MSQAKGYVTIISEKTFGLHKLYSFRISTEEKWFRTGKYKPSFIKNDYISFVYSEQNGGYNVDFGSIELVVNEGTGGDKVSGSGTGAVQSVISKDDYWRRREEADIDKDKYFKANNLRIQYQSARNAAISVVDILVRDKLLKLSDAAKADNVSVVLGKIDDLTNEYFEKCSTVGDASSVNGSSATATAQSAGSDDADSAWN